VCVRACLCAYVFVCVCEIMYIIRKTLIILSVVWEENYNIIYILLKQ